MKGPYKACAARHGLTAADVTVSFFALQKKSTKIPVGPVMLGFFLFVVVGSGKCSAGQFLTCCMHASGHGELSDADLSRVGAPRPNRQLAILTSTDFLFLLLPALAYCPAALLQIIRTATTGQPSM